MSKPRNRNRLEDDNDLFSDGELDLEIFMDDMEEEDELRQIRSPRRRAAWQRLEDLREWRWMRDQLEDWESWELD